MNNPIKGKRPDVVIIAELREEIKQLKEVLEQEAGITTTYFKGKLIFARKGLEDARTQTPS